MNYRMECLKLASLCDGNNDKQIERAEAYAAFVRKCGAHSLALACLKTADNLCGNTQAVIKRAETYFDFARGGELTEKD